MNAGAAPIGAREALGIGALGLLALGLRLAAAAAPRCIETDGVAYLELAEQIAGGGGLLHPVFPPGYSLAIAALHRLGPLGPEAAALAISAVCGALALPAAWWLWRHTLGTPAAWAGAALLAIWPLAVDLGGRVLTDSTSLLGILLALCAWLRSARGERGWAVVAGAGFGGVAWMRPEVLAWSGVAALLLARRRPAAAAALALTTALLYLPYVGLLRAHTGEWQLSAKADANLVYALTVGEADPGARYEELKDARREGRIQGSLPGPTALARRVADNLAEGARRLDTIWPPAVAVAIALGTVLAWRRGLLGSWAWLPLLASAPILLFFFKPRFFLPAAAVWLGLAGLALVELRGAARAAAAALVLWLVLPETLAPIRGPDREAASRAAGLWLAGRSEPAGVVVDRKPFVAYYAGRERVWPEAGPDLAALHERLTAYESALLVVDDRHFRRSRPQWHRALAVSLPSWLEEVARFEGPRGHGVRLLAFRGGSAPRAD